MTLPRRADMLDGRTLLVCIGAAKTGTSWLHSYFCGREDVAVSPLKEVHFFDAKFPETALGDPDRFAMKRLEFHLKAAATSPRTLRDAAALQASLDRVQMIYDPLAYFDHFARLSTDRTRVVCDITPGYSAIGRDGFAYLKAFCAQRGVRVKILFLMRDPVDRLWSQLRHLQQLSAENDVLRDWARIAQSPAIRARADYAQIVRALDDMFDAEDVLHLFYENLFDDPALRALCRFLDLPFSAPGQTETLNETLVKLPLPGVAKEAFSKDLAPQYRFCQTRFADRVPASWLSL
ncbi:sulfotransferase [Dinoroseobacter sp. S375]|uniref:sulfotransferase n=1 Tax=Dinoroseobacter sp. S375 TaxID=3415136 RepID=UPI003C7A5E66